jgi:galactose-1-phosphate uridylyltransferase
LDSFGNFATFLHKKRVKNTCIFCAKKAQKTGDFVQKSGEKGHIFENRFLGLSD